MIPNTIHESWYPVVNLLYEEPLKTLNEEILSNISFQPKSENIFKVFEMPVTDIKVVILGQDPYPTPGDAIGRAFAVSEKTRIPVSLKNIEKEVYQTKGIRVMNDDNDIVDQSWKTLNHWSEQGIFLINSALTVETGKAGSHLKYWQEFTKRVVSFIAQKNPCIWIFWGKKAQQYRLYIQNNPYYVHGYDEDTINNIPSNSDWNYILQAPHPAAEAYAGGKAGFFGCNHFLYTNKILQKTKSMQITW